MSRLRLPALPSRGSLPSPRAIYRQGQEFRRRQREALAESNRPQHARQADIEEQLEHALGADGRQVGQAGSRGQAAERAEDGGRTDGSPDAPASGAATVDPTGSRFGEAGRPFNRHSPLFLGFWGAIGALLAIALWHAGGRLTTTLTILLVACFLTLALHPIVQALCGRGVPRAAAVALVFLGLLGVLAVIGGLVIPPVVEQGSALVESAPTYLQHLLNSPWVRDLDRSYHVVERVQGELSKRLTDEAFITQVVGGILGAGRVVASGVFQTLTILVLTLYFLATLPRIKSAAYAVVPASRRARTVSLSEEIMRRVGSYAIGQVFIATLNACASWVMMTLLGIPYAAVLAVLVGLLGLIPMVGATLGAGLVCLVGLIVSPKVALAALIYYVVYQQIENYLIAPHVMRRTVSVPGAVTVVAALAGGTLLGVLGALLAIPVAAALLLLYDEVLVPRMRQL